MKDYTDLKAKLQKDIDMFGQHTLAGQALAAIEELEQRSAQAAEPVAWLKMFPFGDDYVTTSQRERDEWIANGDDVKPLCHCTAAPQADAARELLQEALDLMKQGSLRLDHQILQGGIWTWPDRAERVIARTGGKEER